MGGEVIETLTAREANQQFSRLLNAVANGKEFVVTRNGVPVARIVPERGADGRRRLSEAQRKIMERSRTRLLGGKPGQDAGLSRTELYDEALGIERPA